MAGHQKRKSKLKVVPQVCDRCGEEAQFRAHMTDGAEKFVMNLCNWCMRKGAQLAHKYGKDYAMRFLRGSHEHLEM